MVGVFLSLGCFHFLRVRVHADLRSRSLAPAIFCARRDRRSNIPTEDSDAWQWYPAHRWVYDKLAVALSQGLEAGPHGMPPPRFPVFSKPIVNLKGMGVGSRVLRSQADYERALRARPFLDDAARRPPRVVRRRGGRRRAALVAARHRQAGGRGHIRLLDRPCRARAGDRRALRRVGAQASRRLYRHAQSRNHRRHASSRCICALPTSGPISTAPAGSMRWCGFTRQATGISPMAIAATATASCCSGRNGVRYRHPPPALRRRDQAHAGRLQRADHLPRG